MFDGNTSSVKEYKRDHKPIESLGFDGMLDSDPKPLLSLPEGFTTSFLLDLGVEIRCSLKYYFVIMCGEDGKEKGKQMC